MHEIPQAGRAAKGKPIVNLINVTADTKVSAMVPVREFRDDQFLLFVTKGGTVKKTALSQYANPRSTGIKAIKIEEDDELIDVQVTQRHERHRARDAGTASRSGSTRRTCARWAATRPA